MPNLDSRVCLTSSQKNVKVENLTNIMNEQKRIVH